MRASIGARFLSSTFRPRLYSPRVRPLIVEHSFPYPPELVLGALVGSPGTILLCSGSSTDSQSRYSFLVTRPFLQFQSRGSVCEARSALGRTRRFGNPWRVLEGLMHRYEVNEDIDQPFPLGGCFGYWGYELRRHIEPRLPARHPPGLGLPEAQLGFYDSLVVFDHFIPSVFIVATGLRLDGSRTCGTAQRQIDFWREILDTPVSPPMPPDFASASFPTASSSLNEASFVAAVTRAKQYIRSGDIYQVNLSHRLAVDWVGHGSDLFRRLLAVSPAPFAAYLDGGPFQLTSSSPELFLRFSGRHVLTRPIKGTRPRGIDATRDAQLAYELQTSPKELAELLMITDLLRNDLGRICEFGSIHVPELARLERFPQVQHLVATIEGRLRPELSHLSALSQCFPGGSITGAPKIRAMEVIDELEPIGRGPYTGALGYLGFNEESQLSIVIRTAITTAGKAWFHTGAGIVADSSPEAEYAETLAKAGGFLRAVSFPSISLPGPESLPHAKGRGVKKT